MVYFKVLLNDKRQKSDNIYPVVVRVTYNRNNTTLNTGIRVDALYWDADKLTVKSSHPNALFFNKSIADFNSKVQNQAYKLFNEQRFGFEELKKGLNEGHKPSKVVKSPSFKKFAQQLVDDMLSINKAGNAIVYQTAINRLVGYVGDDSFAFTAITYTMLEGFQRQLIKDRVKPNSISNYFRTLRAIFNKAIKARIVDRSNYPFLDVSIKTERTAKRAITIDDLNRLVDMQLKPKSPMWNAVNYAMLSFTLIGASFTDLAYLKPEHIIKGRLVYRRRKTGKELSIKLHPQATALFELYSDDSRKYLLPVLPSDTIEGSKRAKVLILQWIKTTNKHLSKLVSQCKVEALVTTYVIRHSWATAAKRLGFAIEMISEAMGHEHGNKITNIYLDTFDQQLIDEMNDKVICKVIPCPFQVKYNIRFALRPNYTKQSVHLPLKLAA